MSQELDTAQDVSTSPSQEEAQVVNNQEQERQPVDLTKLDEFKKWQSAQDSKIAQRDNYYQNALRQEQAARAQLEQQFHMTRMQGMNEQEQLAYQNQLLQGQLAELARQRELDQYAFTRQRDLEEISKKTGVAFDKLSGFNTSHEAWDFAVEEMKNSQSQGKTRRSEAEAETPDPVDIGGTKAKDQATKLYNEWNEAMTKDYDMGKAMRLEEKAIQAGIDPQSWKPRK